MKYIYRVVAFMLVLVCMVLLFFQVSVQFLCCCVTEFAFEHHMFSLFVYSSDYLILLFVFCFFFCKQKTASEMRISDWSSDVCSSDLLVHPLYGELQVVVTGARSRWSTKEGRVARIDITCQEAGSLQYPSATVDTAAAVDTAADAALDASAIDFAGLFSSVGAADFVLDSAATSVQALARSEEHTSELPSLMPISYDVFCWKQKKHNKQNH